MKDALFSNLNSGVVTVGVSTGNIDDDDETSITWKEVFNGRRTGIQVWKTKDVLRDLFPTFNPSRRNNENLVSILFNIDNEIYYDNVQIQSALVAFYCASEKAKGATIKELQKSNAALEDSLDFPLEGEVYNNYLKQIDDTFETELFSCFKDFTFIDEPIVADKMMLDLINKYKRLLPNHFK